MEWVNKFGAVLALATLVVLALVYLFSVAKKGRQDIVRQDNADLRASNQEMRTEKAATEAKLAEQQESIRYLKDVATQTPAVTKLIDMIGQQQGANAKQHTQVISELSKLTGKISDLAGQFGTLAAALNEANKSSKEK
jgi:hypothetical protein